MGVGVIGQYYISFQIGSLVDFIREEDLLEFAIAEEAGNTLPVFRLSFESENEDLLGLLNEANVLKISFGLNRDATHEVSLTIKSLQSRKTGPDRRFYGVEGCLSQSTYVLNPHVYITDKISGVEAIKQTIGFQNYFSWDSNIPNDKSLDSMRWVQPNITDRVFVSNIWLHSYLPESFLAVAISSFGGGRSIGSASDRPSQGSFIIRDVKEHIRKSGSQAWKLTQTPQSTFDIPYSTDYAIEVTSGDVNKKIGYGRQLISLSLENGDETEFYEDVVPILGNTSEIVRNRDIWASYGGTVVQNENVHKNYWQARLKNMGYLAVMSTVKLTVSVSHRFLKIKPLDLVLFKDVSTKGSGIAGYHSGLYLVGKVTRQISQRRLKMQLELYRDALNDGVGDFRIANENTSGDNFGTYDDEDAYSESQRTAAVNNIIKANPNLNRASINEKWEDIRTEVLYDWDGPENEDFYIKVATILGKRAGV